MLFMQSTKNEGSQPSQTQKKNKHEQEFKKKNKTTLQLNLRPSTVK